MALAEEKDDGRRRKSGSPGQADEKAASGKKKRPPVPEVGTALRSAYEQTVREDIPPEMLDLLGKLG